MYNLTTQKKVLNMPLAESTGQSPIEIMLINMDRLGIFDFFFVGLLIVVIIYALIKRA